MYFLNIFSEMAIEDKNINIRTIKTIPLRSCAGL
jgi:hypothetical protein